MRRCPKCNRTYQTDTQKFCTHDGGLLFDIDAGLHETVQFDSTKIRDAVAKPTTRDLDAQLPAQFDPEATVVSPGGVGDETIIASAPGDDDATVQVSARDTQDLEPQVTQHEIQPPAAAATSDPSAATLVTPPSGPITPPPTPTPPTSGPIAPAQTSAPLPPSQPAGSGQIGTSAPLPGQPVAQPGPSQPLPAAPAKKKSKAPFILGILAVLLVLGLGVVVAAYLVVVRPMLAKRQAVISTPSEPTSTTPTLPTTATPAEVSKPVENEPPPYSPPADAVQFVNSKDELAGKLLENYVDFSFYYPDRWVKVPSSDNFIKVERRLPPDFTQENFAVSPWYSPEEVTTFDNDFFRALSDKDSTDFSRKFPDYKKISDGPTKVGAYDGYEFRFEAVSRGTDKGDITLWGREIFFPPRAGEKTGLKFLILTTSLAPELKSASDVGEKGELPMLLESFRFGKK
jgi:flagellar basal body-associated protein FliL